MMHARRSAARERRQRLVACATCLFGAAVQVACAHDFRGVIHSGQSDEAAVTHVFYSASDERTRQVLEQVFRWPTDRPITVCFFGGSPRLRADIGRVAEEWTPGTSLKFDFGGPHGRTCSGTDREGIRIAFQKDAGFWSLIGTDSLDHPGASMNLASFDTDRPDELQFRAHVLHEFGHAIGFWHEQQHPGMSCDFAKPYIMTHEGMTENEYERDFQIVQQEMFGHDQQRYKFWLPDPDSVMIYTGLPKEFFESGAQSPCYRPQTHSVLSDGDRTAVRDMYPIAGTGSGRGLARDVEIEVLETLQTDPAIRGLVERRLHALHEQGQ